MKSPDGPAARRKIYAAMVGNNPLRRWILRSHALGLAEVRRAHLNGRLLRRRVSTSEGARSPGGRESLGFDAFDPAPKV